MQILKTLVVALLVAGVIPLLLGLLFELVIVAPLRVPLDQTPLFYPWQVIACSVCFSISLWNGCCPGPALCFNIFAHLQDWALGVLHAKIIAAITLMGPQWWLKTVIEQVGFKCLILRCQNCSLPTLGTIALYNAQTANIPFRCTQTEFEISTSSSSSVNWRLQSSRCCCWPCACRM